MNKLVAQIGYWSSLVVVAGLIMSGLIGNLIIVLIAPQQLNWQSIDYYAASFHSVQTLPQAAGIIIVLGFIGVMVSIHFYTLPDKKILGQLGIIFATIYATIVSVNYIIILSVVKTNIQSGNLDGLTLHIVGNPYSISWAREMLGYGFMGLSTLVTAPIFQGNRLKNWIRWLFIWNGITGIFGVIGIGIADPGWVLAPIGLASWLIWTVVIIIPFVLLCILFKQTIRDIECKNIMVTEHGR